MAIDLEGAQGDLTDTRHVVWTRNRNTPYVTDLSGTTVVLTHEQSPKAVAVNRLNESVSASAAIEGDAIFIRGKTHLYCIGHPSGQ